MITKEQLDVFDYEVVAKEILNDKEFQKEFCTSKLVQYTIPCLHNAMFNAPAQNVFLSCFAAGIQIGYRIKEQEYANDQKSNGSI